MNVSVILFVALILSNAAWALRWAFKLADTEGSADAAREARLVERARCLAHARRNGADATAAAIEGAS